MRGRERLGGRHSRGPHPDSTHNPSTEEEEEEDEEYLCNQIHNEIPNVRSLGIDKFSNNDKDNDWVIWANQFEQAVNRAHNPHSRLGHYNYCLKWLPGCLKPDAYAIWQRQKHAKTSWPKLKKDLTEAFEDPFIREQWKSDPYCFKWDPKTMSLQTYCAKVQRYVDTFQSELANSPEALKEAYYLRFLHGLDDDYQEYIRLSKGRRKMDINVALEMCITFQSVLKMREKKGKTETKNEVGASVTWQDQTVSSRVTKNEIDIKRMDSKLDQILKNQTASSKGQATDTNTSGNPGSSPHPAKSKGSYDDRRKDRMNRFFNRRGNWGAKPFRKDKKPDTQPAAASEEAGALETEPESGGEADDTLAMYDDFMAAKEYDNFDEFCGMLDAKRQQELAARGN